MNIRKIIKEEINDFNWVEEHEFTYKELIQHIQDNNITEWTFGEHWGGDLNLRGTPIQSLGNLKSVGGYLSLYETQIQSLGNLKTVGGYVDLGGTPISKKYSDFPTQKEQEIRQMVQVNGEIYLSV